MSTELFQQAYAFIPQSSVSDICFNAQRGWRRDTIGLELLSNGHDALTLQFECTGPDDVPVDSLVEFAQGESYMNPELEYQGRRFHIGTDMKLGVALGHEDMVTLPCSDVQSLKQALEEKWSTISGEAH